jgi:hypothetical protein
VSQTIHASYRSYTDSPSLWARLVSDYSHQRMMSRALLLSQIAEYRPPIDMDQALQDHAKHVRQLRSAFGSTMDTELVVQILFTHNLPSEYALAKLNAIESTFNFDQVELMSKHLWNDLKCKKTKSFQAKAPPPAKAPTSATACPVHPTWQIYAGGQCFKCHPCARCLQAGAHKTFHRENTPKCTFYAPASKVKLATADPVDSGCTNHIFRNKDVFGHYSNCPSTIETASGSIISIPGRGTTHTLVVNGTNKTTLEGLYYPDLSEEALFSVGRFDEQGFGSVFANQRVKT